MTQQNEVCDKCREEHAMAYDANLVRCTARFNRSNQRCMKVCGDCRMCVDYPGTMEPNNCAGCKKVTDEVD